MRKTSFLSNYGRLHISEIFLAHQMKTDAEIPHLI